MAEKDKLEFHIKNNKSHWLLFSALVFALVCIFIVFAVSISAQSPHIESSPALITINFSQEVGEIRADFYGANTHSFLEQGMKIDADSDGISESLSDTAWHRQAWLNSKMSYMRWDMSLGSRGERYGKVR